MLATAPCERDRLIEQNLDYARRLATRMARRLPRSVDVEELESDAYLGLLKAAESFDPRRGVAFTTYAATRINGAMLDGLRERALARRRQPRPVVLSLNEPVADDLGRPVTHLDCLVDHAPPVGLALELREEAERAMQSWPGRLRRTWRDAHLRGLSQEQIARKQGVSASCISLRMAAIRPLLTAARSRAEAPTHG